MARWLFFVLFLPVIVKAQVWDDFSDGNLQSNPTWIGDTAYFQVTAGVLHLSAPSTISNASIFTASKAIYETSWELSISLDFNPSSSNYARIFLTADQPNPGNPLNGYFVQLGNTTDEVSLYRQTGNSIVKIIDGIDGRLNLSTVKIALKIYSDDQGTWSLFSKLADEVAWFLEGTVVDTTHQQSGWLGIQCVFTSTRSDKFHFDDLKVNGSIWPDQTPPELIQNRFISSDQVELQFNELLNLESVMDRTHFMIQDPAYSILEVELMKDQKTITLRMGNVKEGVPINLLINGVRDVFGNAILNKIVTLLYWTPYSPKVHDVIFNEVMPDPVPEVGLPPNEYVELFNRTEHFINLERWKFSDGSTTAILPFMLIPPKGYVTIYSSEPATNALSGIHLSNFPSLNNLGDRLSLFSDTEVLMDTLIYKSSWHTVEGKSNGGWSLERIDPDDFCRIADNWTSSEHPKGGTPGQINSVFAHRPDEQPPTLLDVEVMNATSILLSFSEPIELDPTFEVIIHPDPGSRESIHLPGDHQIEIGFKMGFLEKIRYQIEVIGIRDCPGNSIEKSLARRVFFVSEQPEPSDVVINEILFNPMPGGVDFVELFNRSNKYFRLRGWYITDLDSIHMAKEKITSFELSPFEFLVLTKDAKKLKLFFPSLPDSVIVDINLPSLPDDHGQVAIADQNFMIIDSIEYDESYHLRMIRNEEGVSLERIDPDAPSNFKENWRSAAFGIPTPGARNSVYLKNKISSDRVRMDPSIFSINSGQNFARMFYEFEQTGIFITATIYDEEGRLIKLVSNNQNLGTTGFIRWDGDRTDGRAVHPGFYILVADFYDESGPIFRYRSRVLVVK